VDEVKKRERAERFHANLSEAGPSTPTPTPTAEASPTGTSATAEDFDGGHPPPPGTILYPGTLNRMSILCVFPEIILFPLYAWYGAWQACRNTRLSAGECGIIDNFCRFVLPSIAVIVPATRIRADFCLLKMPTTLQVREGWCALILAIALP